jgi:hypothetical protein
VSVWESDSQYGMTSRDQVNPLRYLDSCGP